MATSRALRSLSTTSNSSPAFGAPDSPSTTTGIDGPAEVDRLAGLVEQRAHPAEFLADQDRIAELQVPRSTSTVATAPRPFSRLDSMT
jgi:hypothetical protein